MHGVGSIRQTVQRPHRVLKERYLGSWTWIASAVSMLVSATSIALLRRSCPVRRLRLREL
jgi:hypothetical protein